MTTMAGRGWITDADCRRGLGVLDPLTRLLAVLVTVGSLVGVFAGGGPGRQVVETARGATVTLYGDGLYAADTWLVGAGNRGQDVAMLLVEVPVLLLVVGWYRRHCSPVAAAALTGVLAFFTYFCTSMVLATAQNRLFPVYVAAASCAAFALVATVSHVDLAAVSAELPRRPGRAALAAYLIGVAAALTAAWLPRMLSTAVSGEVAEAVGPYTSSVTEALDLGIVVPVVVIAAVMVLARRPGGRGLAFVILVLNVCIGVLLLAQGTAQLVLGVPLTTGEIIGLMLTFAALTLVAGALLTRMAVLARAEEPVGVSEA
jgi:hypothetical protein